MDTFRSFSPTHAGVLVAFAVFTTALVYLGRAWRGTQRQRALDRTLTIVALLFWLISNGWWALPARFDLALSLPLHVCDFVGIIVVIALLWCSRWSRAMLYYWGLGLSTQGFITPALREGPGQIGFWTFWAFHFLVCGIAIYDLAARGFRPTWRDFRFAALVSILYVALMLPIDVWLDVNYGYIGRGKPDQPSLIDVLGPWPWRVAIMVALAIGVMALITLPWEIARWFKAAHSETATRGSSRSDTHRDARRAS